jgi:hypothetical protein
MSDYDPLNPESTAAARKTAQDVSRVEREKQLADVLYVMVDPAGRRFMKRLLEHATVFQSTFAPGDPHQTSFNEGRRTLGLWALGEVMEIAAEQYLQMMKDQ